MPNHFPARVRPALAFLALLSVASQAVFAANADGPYVLADGQNRWLARWVEEGSSPFKVREQRLKVGQQFEVGMVGSCPPFNVRLRKPEPLAPDEVSFPSTRPLFIVADTHGEYEILCGFLRRHQVVDSSLRWAFGRGHLVVLGDIFDRGPNQTEILWWLYQLQADAARAGGGVHVLLGNHEVMALRGDARYLNPKYKETAAALNAESYAQLFAPETVLGQWLRTLPSVIKVNNVLCLHGGISREMVDGGFTLSEMNAAVRSVISGAALSEREALITGRLGPQWYRGYFADQKEFRTATDEDVDGTLKAFKVQTIAVGHTIVPTVTPLYDHRVLAVQVYPHTDEETHAPILEGVLLSQGKWLRASSNGTRLPLF